MAGFSLGGGAHQRHGPTDDSQIPPESLFLYSAAAGAAASSSTGAHRGFELWQHHQRQQQQQQHHLYSAASGSLLAFGPTDDPINQNPPRHPPRSAAAGMSCQDCGNQAKKDCVHMRCRTCCKSRGFHCPTHVKSTWVPAAKRRERQQQLAVAAALHQQQRHPSPSQHRAATSTAAEPSKRPRDLSVRLPTIIATTTSGGTEPVLSFPAEVSSPAVFRCVRVSPMDEAEDQFAYQTAVNISGHVFKGILYDQGPESTSTQFQHHLTHVGESSSGGPGGAPSTSAMTAGTVGLLPDPSSLYPAPLSAFMAGTQFFPHHPRP